MSETNLHNMAEEVHQLPAPISEMETDVRKDKGKEVLRPLGRRLASRREAAQMDPAAIGALVFRSKRNGKETDASPSFAPVFEESDEDIESFTLEEPEFPHPEDSFNPPCPFIETDAGMQAFLESPDNLEIEELAIRISLVTVIYLHTNHSPMADLERILGPFPSNIKRLNLLKKLGLLKVLHIQIFGAGRVAKYVKDQDIQLGMKWLVEKLIRFQPGLQHLIVQYRLRHYRHIKPGRRLKPRPVPFASWDEVHMEFKRVVDAKDRKRVQWNATMFSLLPNIVDDCEKPKYEPWHTLMARVKYSTTRDNWHSNGTLGRLFLLDESLLTPDAATGRLGLW